MTNSARPGWGGGLAVLLVAALAVPMVVLVGTGILAGPANAHTDLLRASPGPAQQAGGTVDFVDLVFLESVTGFDVQVEGPDGERVPGGLNATSGQLFRFEMDAITEPGRYVVRYTMISADGDFTDTGFFFTFDPTAPQPLPLGDVDVPDTGTSLVAILAGLVFVACMIGLAILFLARLEQKRAHTAASELSSSSSGGESGGTP